MLLDAEEHRRAPREQLCLKISGHAGKSHKLHDTVAS